MVGGSRTLMEAQRVARGVWKWQMEVVLVELGL